MSLFVPSTSFTFNDASRRRNREASMQTTEERVDKSLPSTPRTLRTPTNSPTSTIRKTFSGKFNRSRLKSRVFKRRGALEHGTLAAERKASDEIGPEDEVPMKDGKPVDGEEKVSFLDLIFERERGDGLGLYTKENVDGAEGGGKNGGNDDDKEKKDEEKDKEDDGDEEREARVKDKTAPDDPFGVDLLGGETDTESVAESGTIPYFRCDIFSVSGKDFKEAEEECKQLVMEADGTVIEDKEYIGGFLYTLPDDLEGPGPLESGDKTLGGGYITITPVKDAELNSSKPEPSTAAPAFATLFPPPASSPVPPLTNETSSTKGEKDTPTRLRPKISILSSPEDDAAKQWPRPKEPGQAERAANWVGTMQAKHREQLLRDAEAGVDKEVVPDSEQKGGIRKSELYMDGFSPLATAMEAGVCSTQDETGTKLC